MKKFINNHPTLYAIFHVLANLKTIILFQFYRPPFTPKIENSSTTIQKILDEHLSVSRYGDGELNWMVGNDDQTSFEIQSDQLQRRLQEIISSNLQHHIVTLPMALKTLDDTTFKSIYFWEKQLLKNGSKWFKYIDPQKTYYDTNITRPYIDKKNKQTTGQIFRLLLQIWSQRDVLIVEGTKTRFGVGNDLLKNARSIRRVECPPKNAFENYETILKTVTKVARPNDIILVALGPTATVLAYDLCKQGLQTIDIGHADIEYEWFKQGATEKTAVTGKYVNEVTNHVNGNLDTPDLKTYQAQIIATI
ncbi:GT-D fold domain-containing glycosyltransferase [Fructilactobacillus myrtifloralis]|uniref:GT-D fold domain-containing glycosyltransferase n=1 Tax=Fructilactobacillus myrtifloralis TaxID=2940301 RepID=A0ABY5BND6_9LACO|nr:GT-D fold domain-containing glycosyltransferase [Fructilactobacillus myrtifloralis]USS84721.1 GT-D fold domain-containing glycosyltransferase [Fructilactobacillus myrtifloralis]